MRFLLFIWLFPACCFAQNMQTDWQKMPGRAGDQTISQVIEATNGNLVAVGQTTSSTAGGSDGWLLVSDHSTGQVLFEKRFGGKKDDVLYSVAQTFEGNFLLAGATASQGKGKTDGWLLLVNDRGDILRETVQGTPGRDEYRFVLLQPDGSVLLAGQSNDGDTGDVWLSKMRNDSLQWEKNLGSAEFNNLSGLVSTPDGGLVFCGNTGKKAENGDGNIYLAKADAKGKLLWKKFFGEKGWEEALALITTRDGGFAMAGLNNPKGPGDPDGWLLKANRDGTRQWDKSFGGKNPDLFQALVQTPDGGFLLAGATQSQRSGARFSDAWLVQTTPGGDLEWEQPQGSDKDDVFTAAILLHNGSVVLAGKYDGNSTWLLRCSDVYHAANALAGIRDAVSVKVSEAALHTADGTLTPGQQSYVSFVITNTTDLDLPDLRVSVDNKSGSGDIIAWNTNYYGAIAKAGTLEARIPVKGSTELEGGEQTMSFTITAGNKTLQSFDKSFTLRKPRPATLIIADHQFSGSGSSDQVTLKVSIENTGDSTSRAAEVVFGCPAGYSAKTASTSPMGLIPAHSRRDVRFVFEKNAGNTANSAAISCKVREANRDKVAKNLTYQEGNSSMISKGPILVWTDPAPHETGSNKVRKTDDHIEVKMTVVSPKPVNTKNIKVKVNGVEMDGSKFNEEDLSAPRQEESRFIYTYKNKIPLQQGNNHVEVVVDDVVSDALEVEFAPERANLYVLSIGPTHEDLQYTTRDAIDFARAFQGQGGEGKLFNEVFVTELTTPEKTDLTGIKQAMYDLAYQWDDHQIKQSDMLIVFISSHGKIADNRFKILQTGYNPKYERLAVDYKTDILEVLNNINCKKLIFLDACHSGGAKEGFGGVSKAVVDLAKTQPGFSTLTSCGSTEKSYEDKAWSNGAFTEALLDAFSGKSCTDANGAFSADTDGDHILRLGELYDFLRRRVPDMVKSAIPNAPTGQTPFMPESQLDKNLPVYLVRGEK
ncbi:MAG: caspase family protein [Saprospiraceae bacterium]|nr:caspase family protein [Saprospiraceae bacterium]